MLCNAHIHTHKHTDNLLHLYTHYPLHLCLLPAEQLWCVLLKLHTMRTNSMKRNNTYSAQWLYTYYFLRDFWLSFGLIIPGTLQGSHKLIHSAADCTVSKICSSCALLYQPCGLNNSHHKAELASCSTTGPWVGEYLMKCSSHHCVHSRASYIAVLDKKNGGISPRSFRWSGYAVTAMYCSTECSERVFGKLWVKITSDFLLG